MQWDERKGISPVSLLRCKLSNIFVGRSICICSDGLALFRKSFQEHVFTVSLILQNKLAPFTSLLAADIVNNDIKGPTNDSRKNVFIIDDSLFNRTSCKKTELGSKVFDHTNMHFKKDSECLL